MRWSLDDVPLFVAIVRHGGLSAAAAATGRPKSTLSTALARLEQGLGLKLMERNSRHVRLTEEGERFYDHCLAILGEVQAADAMVTGLAARPSGRLSVALPPAFAAEIVAPSLPGFVAAYPEIALEVTVSDRTADVMASGHDLAVVVGELEDSQLTRRVLMQGRLIWIAAPSYMAAHPEAGTAAALAGHILACERRYGTGRLMLRGPGGARALDLPRRVVRLDDPLALRAFVIGGGGVSFLPERYCREAIARGALVEVAPELAFEQAASALSAVYPARRLMAPRLRVFLDFLVRLGRAHG